MVIGNSNEIGTKKMLLEHCEEFDFILIDGDHSEAGVLRDMELYMPLLRSGGLVAFHDVQLDPPRGIKPYWYNRIKGMLPGSTEHFHRDDNCGYGLWVKP